MEEDIKRLQSCYEHEDYYSMLTYINIIIDNYYGMKRKFLLQIKSFINQGNYVSIESILKSLKNL